MIPGPSSSQEFLSFAARSNRLRRTGMNAPHSLRYIFSFYLFIFFFSLFCKSSLTRKIPRPIHHLSFSSSSTSFITGSIHALSTSSETIRSWIFLIHQWQWVGRYRRFARESCRPPYFCLSFFFKTLILSQFILPYLSNGKKKKKWNENRIKKKKGTNLCISAWSRTIKERNSTPCAWWICTRRGIKKNQIIDKTKKNKKKKTFLVVWIAILLVTTTTCYCDMCCSVVIFREEIITSN